MQRCSEEETFTSSAPTISIDLLFCLHLSGCLEEGLEALLKATGSNLLILKISHCPNLLTDRSLWLASCYCRALQAVTYRWVSNQGLKRRALTPVAMLSFILNTVMAFITPCVSYVMLSLGARLTQSARR